MGLVLKANMTWIYKGQTTVSEPRSIKMINCRKVNKPDLAAARVPGLDHRTVTSTQEYIRIAGMQDCAHHLGLIVQFRYLLPYAHKEKTRDKNRINADVGKKYIFHRTDPKIFERNVLCGSTGISPWPHFLYIKNPNIIDRNCTFDAY